MGTNFHAPSVCRSDRSSVKLGPAPQTTAAQRLAPTTTAASNVLSTRASRQRPAPHGGTQRHTASPRLATSRQLFLAVVEPRATMTNPFSEDRAAINACNRVRRHDRSHV